MIEINKTKLGIGLCELGFAAYSFLTIDTPFGICNNIPIPEGDVMGMGYTTLLGLSLGISTTLGGCKLISESYKRGEE